MSYHRNNKLKDAGITDISVIKHIYQNTYLKCLGKYAWRPNL